MAQFNVTELDFDKIKQSTIDYFKANPKYADWNFQGSGLSVLMDVLAYNTHYNAMLAHLSLNETFLDSAQLRGNVVSHAKLLGYCPRSALSSTAIVDIVVPAIGIAPPSSISLERGTRFSTIVDSTKYTFTNLNPIESVLDTETNTYSFSGVSLKQGTLKRMLYRVDTSLTNQRFVIPDENVDTSTMRVRIKSNEQATDYTIYTKFTALNSISATSQIYFLQENNRHQYEIYFGDDTLGLKPIDNQIVEIEYVYTDGPVANGAGAFRAVDTIGGSSNPTVTASIDAITNQTILSYGGALRESIESIRYNAPLTFITQNRCVTADDYRAMILREFGNIQAISVWGGENAVTPDYGKVYISIKPVGAEALNSTEKAAVVAMLKGKNVVSITPVLVDPEYTYVSLDVFFKYNPNLTDRTKAELQSLVRTTISTYDSNYLESFDGVFRASALLRAIDSSDPSILNSDIRVFMYKDVTPSATTNNYFDLQYTSPIYKTSSNESVITSSTFLLGGITCYFGDEPITGSNNRQVYIYKDVNGVATKVQEAGTIIPLEGRVILTNFQPDTATDIRITVIPNSNDLAPKRNQLIKIDPLTVNVTGDVDTIAVAGSVGAINYTTPSRHR